MAGELPFDIVEEILVRLPVASIIRFKVVSKLWNSIINDPKFIKYHSTLGVERGRYKTILEPTFGKPYALTFYQEYNNNKERVESKDFSFRFPEIDRAALYGSCNGLLLYLIFPLREYDAAQGRYIVRDDGHIVLVNPSIRQLIRVPFTRPIHESSEDTFGLGYDSSGDDYKILRVPTFFSNDNDPVEIFSLKSNSWKSLAGGCFSSRFLNIKPVYDCHYSGVVSSTFANRRLHWLGLEEVIVYFDLTREEFGKVVIPQDDSAEYHDLCVFRERICLVMSDFGKNQLVIWSMKGDDYDYGGRGWIKIFNIKVPEPSWRPVDKEYGWRPLHIIDENKVLLNVGDFNGVRAHHEKILDGRWEIVEYNRKYNIFKTLVGYGSSFGFWFKSFPYWETLISPNN